jgi:lipid-binding SYLF domain-containing protein
MKPIAISSALVTFVLAALLTTPLPAQIKEGAVVDESAGVLDEIMATPEKGIPASLLADAQGIAIVPSVVKGGLGIGIRFGRGILLVRDETGKWRQPSFITLAGGSFGWQIGVQATDVILVFKTRKSVQTLLSGKLTLGADAAVTAGPVGRQAAAGADVTLRSAVFSYSRSRGLFLGLALDGTAIMIDDKANAAYYGNNGQPTPPPGPQQAASAPPASAARLLEHVEKYTTASGLVPLPGPLPASAPRPTLR